MCAIAGILVPPGLAPEQIGRLDAEFTAIVRRSSDRGRDSHGVFVLNRDGTTNGIRSVKSGASYHGGQFGPNVSAALANLRAEPTTEWVRDKTTNDVQPFLAGDWAVTHNGTVANDAALRDMLGLVPDSAIDSAVLPHLLDRIAPAGAVSDGRYPGGTIPGAPPSVFLGAALANNVVGSYALAAVHRAHPNRLLLAANYKPIHLGTDRATGAVFFASQESYLAATLLDRLGARPVVALPPYTSAELWFDGAELRMDRIGIGRLHTDRALVVCSGGLDSTVAAAAMERDGFKVTLLHFDYGCRATGHELAAVKAIAARTGWPLLVVPLGALFTGVIGASPLTDGSPVNTEGRGVAGAEFAHEWVPARNLIMLAVATGIAEAHGFDAIGLGNNLEESGAYPDNEMEFVHLLGAVLPYAVGPKRTVRLMMPVGNLMKREVVKLGHDLGAPLDLTWSCYHAGPVHCGECGPCYMRATAHEMNGLADPVFARVTA
jgi:7-cyano-7-deazaguanine synthase